MRATLRALRFAIGNHGYAAGVIAAIFQPSQTFEQHRYDVTLRNRADNSAHGVVLYRLFLNRSKTPGARRQGTRSSTRAMFIIKLSFWSDIRNRSY